MKTYVSQKIAENEDKARMWVLKQIEDRAQQLEKHTYA